MVSTVGSVGSKCNFHMLRAAILGDCGAASTETHQTHMVEPQIPSLGIYSTEMSMYVPQDIYKNSLQHYM